MDPNEYCKDKVAPDGSTLYYALLFASAAVRRRLTALNAVCEELREVVSECTDAGTARVKLNWWAEEFDRLVNGSPLHPASRALLASWANPPIDGRSLNDMLLGTAAQLDSDGFRRFTDLERAYRLSAGSAGKLGALACGAGTQSALTWGEEIGTALELVRRLPTLGRAAKRPWLPVSEEELVRHGIDPERLRDAPADPRVIALVRAETERATTRMVDVLGHVPRDVAPSLTPLLTIARIELATLRRLSRKHAPRGGRTGIAPLQKLWIAWREARKSVR